MKQTIFGARLTKITAFFEHTNFRVHIMASNQNGKLTSKQRNERKVIRGKKKAHTHTHIYMYYMQQAELAQGPAY